MTQNDHAPESFASLFESEYSAFNVKPGSIVSGTVVSIDKDWVIVDTSLKSESVIPRSEFSTPNGGLEVGIGDHIDVAIEIFEDGFGETRLSRERARRIEDWQKLEQAYEGDLIIKGHISERVKGGMTVELNSIRAFLPGSLVDVRPLKDTSHLENTEQEFKIVKMDKVRNNIVVSRRAVLDKEYFEERAKLLDGLVEGSVVKGVVKNITDYGAFIDLGGIDGLLHITDMSWRRIRHPSEVVKIGDELEVIVLKFSKEDQRVSLGLRQMQANPWENILEKYQKQEIYKAHVTNITDYGCFAEIEPGVEGLVHVSEMDWTNKSVHPSKIVSVGDEVEVMLLDINTESRRISLGIKQCKPNPWKTFEETYAKGDTVSGPVRSITDFGIFIGLNGTIDGLIYLSDIHWDLPGEKAIQEYKKGQEIEAVVLGVDSDRERISLGIKQLSQDPFMNFTATNPKGTVVTGTITVVEPKQVTVQLAENIVGTIRVYELSLDDDVKDATTVVQEGNEISAKIISVDKKNRSISLSVRAKDIQQDKQALQSMNVNASKVATIGDLIKEQLEND